MRQPKDNIAPLGRVEIIYTLLCRGLSRANIFEYTAENKWKESDEQIDDYLDVAIARLSNAAQVNVAAETGKALERLNHLYMESIKCQDHKTALGIQKEINRLLKLKATETKTPARAEPPLRFRVVK